MEYFREEFVSAKQRTGLDVSEDTEFYVVRMLSDFMKEKLKDMPGNACLGLKYSDMGGNPYETLRNLGDTCTFFCGLFPEHVERYSKLEYQIGKGRRFYNLAFQKGRQKEIGVLCEMEEKLPDIVGTLNTMRDGMVLKTPDAGLLEAYIIIPEWLKTYLLKVVPAKPGRLMS